MDLISAIGFILTPVPFALMLLGVVLGIVVGAIPGLSATMLIALTLPLTFFMDGTLALVLMVAMYVGGVSGGLISATLLRMPGTPASIMTTFDGYPMARRGEPGRALGIGIAASLTGGIIAGVLLAGLSLPLARFALNFGPWEYFTLVLMALVLIASISQGSFVKGLLSGMLGIALSMPGIDPSTGGLRLTFGFTSLTGGFALLPVVIGIFVISQIIRDILEPMPRGASIVGGSDRVMMPWSDWKAQAGNLLRSSLIGTWIGLLPGVGSSIGSIVSYTVAKNVSRHPDRFGTGCPDGIVASEAGNNATVGGALIPLLAMGIPGSSVDAILLAALIVHNLQPGPLLFITNPDLAWAVIACYLIACVTMAAIMFALARSIARLASFPRAWLMPVILVFCLVGTFAVHNHIFDVWVALCFGILGFVLDRTKVPLGPFVIGFVLSGIAEEELRAGLMTSNGSWAPLFTRPIALSFLLISVAFFVFPLVQQWRRMRTSRAG